MQKLQDKVAVITGAASGIGLASARALSRRGTHVVAVDLTATAETAADITSCGTPAVAHATDVSRPDAFDEVRDLALQQFGRVDIVMNNVGVLTNGLPEDIPITEWQRIIDTNLMSVVRSNVVFVPLLLDRAEGHIVNTSSFAGLFTYSYDRMPYAASKAAIVQITEALAIYLRPKNIGVTLLCPGPVLTNIANNLARFGPGAPMRLPGDDFELLDPAVVGELVAEAILANRFFLPTHPAVRDLLRRRVEDWDAFIDYQISREPDS